MGFEQLDRWGVPSDAMKGLETLERLLSPPAFQKLVETLLERHPHWKRPKGKAETPSGNTGNESELGSLDPSGFSPLQLQILNFLKSRFPANGVKEVKPMEIHSTLLGYPVFLLPEPFNANPKPPAPEAGIFFAQIEKEIFAGEIAFKDLVSLFLVLRRLYANALAIAQGKIPDPVQASQKVINRLGQHFPRAFVQPVPN